jgi:hypothetical protein
MAQWNGKNSEGANWNYFFLMTCSSQTKVIFNFCRLAAKLQRASDRFQGRPALAKSQCIREA